MEIVYIVLIVLAVILFVVGIVLWVKHLAKVRREAMEAFANELGLAFHGDGSDQVLAQLGEFQLFNSGRRKQMKNAIVGETDIARISIFDFQYTTGSGKHQHTHYQTVVGMESNELQIPSFSMRPEHFFDWFGSMVGLQDIDFDKHPEYSKMFVLKGEDEAAIREFFDMEILDFFAAKKGIAFECSAGKFIYFRAGKAAKVESLRELLEEGYAVYKAFVARLSR